MVYLFVYVYFLVELSCVAHLERCNNNAKGVLHDKTSETADRMSAELTFTDFFSQKVGSFIFFSYLCPCRIKTYKEMANRRTLKRAINGICEELFVECIAATLYGNENHKDNEEALLFTILKTQSDFIARVSHPEPGMAAKTYFKDLREKFSAQVSEVVDQINNL